MSFFGQLRRWRLGASGPELLASARETRAEQLRSRSPAASLLRALGEVDMSKPHVLAGVTNDADVVRLSVEATIGLLLWAVGSTGSGKSQEVLGFQLPLIQPNPPHAFLEADCKGEGVVLLSTVVLPAILSTWTTQQQNAFLASYRVIDFFDGASLPPGNVLCPRPGMAPELHAREVVHLISEGLGARYNDPACGDPPAEQGKGRGSDRRHVRSAD